MVDLVFQLFHDHPRRCLFFLFAQPLFQLNSQMYTPYHGLLCKLLTKVLPNHKQTFTPTTTSDQAAKVNLLKYRKGGAYICYFE